MSVQPASATALGERVLGLILDARSREDFAADRLQARIGLPVEVAEPGRDYGSQGALAGGWDYALRTMPPLPGEPVDRLLFQLQPQPAPARPAFSEVDMTPVCIPFATWRDRLAGAGFAERRLRERHGMRDYWVFTRGDIGATVYVGEAHGGDAQATACVSMIVLQAYA